MVGYDNGVGTLVAFVARVLQIIPNTLFSILDTIITVQTERLYDPPSRIEKDQVSG